MSTRAKRRRTDQPSATPKKMTGPVIDLDADDDDVLATPKASTSASASMRGKDAWLRDVKQMRERLSGDGVVGSFRRGDSDESCELKMRIKGTPKSVRMTIAIDSADKYLSSHCFFSYADEEVPSFVETALDELGEHGSISLEQAIVKLCKAITGTSKLPDTHPGGVATNGRAVAQRNSRSYVEDDGFASDVTDGADDALFGLGPSHNAPSAEAIAKLLRRDFAGIVDALPCRPGWSHISAGHVVCCSIPIASLDIPAKDLDAWDPCLTSPDCSYRLVLLGLYGAAYTSSFDSAARFPPRFAVGLSTKSKPSKDAIVAAFRTTAGITYTPGEFEDFAQTKPLNALMNDRFLAVFDYRRQHESVGWAGADYAAHQMHAKQTKSVSLSECRKADRDEANLQGYQLPEDPLKGGKNRQNVPLAAFSYLIRRFILCPRFCVICYNTVEHVAVRPFVCSDSLCNWQYQDLALGPSIEYEIRYNTNVVDLLIQLAFAQASAGQMKGFPTLGVHVYSGSQLTWTPDMALSGLLALEGPEAPGAVDVDTLDDHKHSVALCWFINEIPPVQEMKQWLEGEGLSDSDRAMGKTDRALSDIRGGVIPAVVFKVLRWIITSNTSYLREIEDPADLIPSVAKKWRQYRFLQASPQREAKYNEAVAAELPTAPWLATFPDLWSFHGSPMPNWHSILREGLHFQKTSHGRAYGHGIYTAQAAETSMGHYSGGYNGSRWKNSGRAIQKAAAVCRILNVPNKFVSYTPHYVTAQVEWVQTRFLLVEQELADPGPDATEAALAAHEAARIAQSELTPSSKLAMIKQDPKRVVTIAGKPLEIPDYAHRLEQNRSQDVIDVDEEYAPEDAELLEPPKAIDLEDDDGDVIMSEPKPSKPKGPPYQPFAPSKLEFLRVLPPPKSATRAATMSLQREVNMMLKELEKSSPRELGWYFDPDTLGEDNLYHWIVEMIEFDPDIPLTKDMKAKGVPGILFEILFSPSTPFTPPFVRVVWPRFLPFAAGGGGNVTAGGSICMDLLTMTSWSSVYTIPAVLLQIKTAISSMEPRPARLDRNWNTPYSIQEAIEAFKRAANTHGWQVPPDLDKLALGAM